jgi:putative transposase
MNASNNPYAGYRYPAEIISHAVWLYFRFALSFRDIEELLAARGIVVTYEAVRQWCLKFGQPFANEILCRQGRPGDTWFLDEVFITINGQRHYLWRASTRMVMCWIYSCRNTVTNARPSASFVSY